MEERSAASHLLQWRVRQGLSQFALARRVGVARSTISRLERGALTSKPACGSASPMHWPSADPKRWAGGWMGSRAAPVCWGFVTT